MSPEALIIKLSFLKETIRIGSKQRLPTIHQKEPKISYKPVDIRHVKPIQRDYVHAKKINPELEDVPASIQLPL